MINQTKRGLLIMRMVVIEYSNGEVACKSMVWDINYYEERYNILTVVNKLRSPYYVKRIFSLGTAGFMMGITNSIVSIVCNSTLQLYSFYKVYINGIKHLWNHYCILHSRKLLVASYNGNHFCSNNILVMEIP